MSAPCACFKERLKEVGVRPPPSGVAAARRITLPLYSRDREARNVACAPTLKRRPAHDATVLPSPLLRAAQRLFVVTRSRNTTFKVACLCAVSGSQRVHEEKATGGRG